MYKNRFEELFEKNVFSQSEKDTIYSNMKPNNDGQFIGMSDMKINYKYYIGGNIFNNNLLDFVISRCVPPLGMESIDKTFDKYGCTYSGICDGWHWFTKDNITEYAIKNGHSPIEEATKEELWKMLAMSSLYWEGSYREWLDNSKKKSDLLDRFIGDCEMKYFGYDDDGYTLKTIHRIFSSIKDILGKENIKS